ncbi:MAG: hypothetical protein CM1200mP41_12610 [Gammaproteobacteria bacterium]|nr:MAG: hypothetical protein CM1200mP41_12610 [Gammaproteobacteria bacterium]
MFTATFQGDWVNESRQVKPQAQRAKRRVDAEVMFANWRKKTGVTGVVLRVPGDLWARSITGEALALWGHRLWRPMKHLGVIESMWMIYVAFVWQQLGSRAHTQSITLAMVTLQR